MSVLYTQTIKNTSIPNYSLDTSLIKNKVKYMLRKYEHSGFLVVEHNKVIIKSSSEYKKFQILIEVTSILNEENIKHEIDRNFQMRSWHNSAWAKRKDRYAHPILEKTGKLRRSFRKSIFSTHVDVGTSVHYAGVHNEGNSNNVMFGDENRPAPIPQRQFLGSDMALEKLIEQLFYRLLDFTFAYKTKLFR